MQTSALICKCTMKTKAVTDVLISEQDMLVLGNLQPENNMFSGDE